MSIFLKLYALLFLPFYSAKTPLPDDVLNVTDDDDDAFLNHEWGYKNHIGFDDPMMTTDINPANGLPMLGGIGGVDVEGNAYGTSRDHFFDNTMMADGGIHDIASDSFGGGFDSSDCFDSDSFGGGFGSDDW